MDLPLVLSLVLLLLNLPLQNLLELRLQQHLFNRYENLQDHLNHLAHRKLKTNTVRNQHLVTDTLVTVQNYQIVQLVVNYLEFLANKLLKQENVTVLVHVIQTVYVSTHRPPDLPTVGILKTVQTVRVRVNVLQFSHIYEVLALNNHREKLKETRHVALFEIEGEVVSFVDELNFVLEDQSLKFVVLEPVHQHLLVYPKTFSVQQKNASQRKQNLTLLIAVEGLELNFAVFPLFFLEFNAGLKSPIDDLGHHGSIGDEVLVVDSDLVEEVSCSDSVFEVGQDERHELHQFLFGVEIVEAQQGQVVVNREENASVHLGKRSVSDQSNVDHQRLVDALGDVHVLEETVVAFLLGEVGIHVVRAEVVLLHVHQ